MADSFLNLSGLQTFKKYNDAPIWLYVTQESVAKPYVRIASYDTTDDWSDAYMLFAVSRGYVNAGSAIVEASARTNQISTDGTSVVAEVNYLIRSKDFAKDSFYVKSYATQGKFYADLYFKASGTYDSIKIHILTNGGRGPEGGMWKLYPERSSSMSSSRAAMDISTYNLSYAAQDEGTLATISTDTINGLF